MLKQYNYLFLLLVFGLSACATTPDLQTYEERMAALEIGYQEILRTSTRWKKEGRLSYNAIQRLDSAFDQYESLRNTALAVIRTGDLMASEQAIDNVSSVLTGLRTLLAGYNQ